jgi:hypothetical protein
MPDAMVRPAFTLRFRDERTHRALRHAAEELGTSMSELAERAIERELARVGVQLEDKLRRTVELLGSYREQHLLDDIEAFARAEIEEDDPLRSRAVQPLRDPLGVRDTFAHPME